jgi:hypothetical protein
MSDLAYEQEQVWRFHDVLGRIEYPDFTFVVSANKGSFILQIECDDRCNTTGTELRWKSRKWLLSAHMTDGEIVQTAFKAVLTAAEHELREKFTYRGVSIFDPHYDIEKLVELRSKPDSLKERDNGNEGRS